MNRDPQKKLGERIRARRQELGRTQDQVASQAGISQVHLSNVERGEVDVGLHVLKRIAAALDTPAGALLSEIIQLSEEAIAFGKAFDQAPAELRAAILAFLSRLPRERGQS